MSIFLLVSLFLPSSFLGVSVYVFLFLSCFSEHVLSSNYVLSMMLDSESKGKDRVSE